MRRFRSLVLFCVQLGFFLGTTALAQTAFDVADAGKSFGATDLLKTIDGTGYPLLAFRAKELIQDTAFSTGMTKRADQKNADQLCAKLGLGSASAFKTAPIESGKKAYDSSKKLLIDSPAVCFSPSVELLVKLTNPEFKDHLGTESQAMKNFYQVLIQNGSDLCSPKVVDSAKAGGLTPEAGSIVRDSYFTSLTCKKAGADQPQAVPQDSSELHYSDREILETMGAAVAPAK